VLFVCNVYTHTHTHTHKHTRIYLHTHIYIYIYIHTHTHKMLEYAKDKYQKAMNRNSISENHLNDYLHTLTLYVLEQMAKFSFMSSISMAMLHA